MKVRYGFVSNSSSASYIVIDTSKIYILPKYEKSIVIDSNFGEIEFGWGPEYVKDLGSRITFSYLQAIDVHKTEWVTMLEEVIKEHTGVENIVWKITNDYAKIDDKAWNKLEYGYVDHQSSANEGQNTEMFDSKEILKDFIFGQKSMIVVDNDNH